MAWRISKDGRMERLVVFATVRGRPIPLGELVFEGKTRRQSVFRYAGSWLNRKDAWPVAPVGLPLRTKASHSTPYEVPLPFFDAAPDGWGKEVLIRAFPNQVFGLGEFLGAAGDDRVGDLRFGPTPEDGPAQWQPGPPFIALPDGTEDLEALQAAAEAVDEGRGSVSHLHFLYRHSADIGGARPKTRLRRPDGSQWIAKFRAQGDGFDHPRVEAACLTVARACGIEVPDHEVVEVANRSVLLVRRFDRDEGAGRLGYMSAATLMGANPTAYATSTSYAEIAAKARSVGVVRCEAELFRRVLFNCAIHNTDDHLRNHAFIRDPAGQWRLSPAFDIVPNATPRLVIRPAPGADPHPDVDAAFLTHEWFKLSGARAADIRGEIADGLRTLRAALDQWKVSGRDIETLGHLIPMVHA